MDASVCEDKVSATRVQAAESADRVERLPTTREIRIRCSYGSGSSRIVVIVQACGSRSAPIDRSHGRRSVEWLGAVNRITGAHTVSRRVKPARLGRDAVIGVEVRTTQPRGPKRQRTMFDDGHTPRLVEERNLALTIQAWGGVGVNRSAGIAGVIAGLFSHQERVAGA